MICPRKPHTSPIVPACPSPSAPKCLQRRARVGKFKHRMMTLGEPDMDRLPSTIKDGIKSCIDIFTGNPPVGGETAKSSFGFNAYIKWADLLITTPKARRVGRSSLPQAHACTQV